MQVTINPYTLASVSCFDTVNRSTLIKRTWVGILTYFLPIPLTGVLHLLLLILCPLLLLYPVVCRKVQSWDLSCLLPLGHILNNFEDISYYCYTADISLYLSLKPQNVTKLSVVQDCIHIIKD